MERTLPRPLRSNRRRTKALAILCALALTGALAMLPGAWADDLDQKHKKAERGVNAAKTALEDSSAAALQASAKLTNAKAQLADAQRELAATEGELTAARALDQQMQAKLVQAEQALARAEAELVQGEADVKEQRAAIGRLAAADFQFGDPRLLGLSAVLQGADPIELATQLDTIDNLMSREQNSFDDLQAAEALLTARKQEVETARAQVAKQRREAAANLKRKQELERQAREHRAQVAALVGQREELAAAAQRAKAADAAKLREAKQAEARIKKLILARAKKQKSHGYRGDSGGFLRRPVDGYITSPYGYRIHPIYGYWGLHNGTDFHAPCGTPEMAGAAGTVISEYYSDVWGNRLFLDVGKFNGQAMTLVYNHISSYRVGTGARVGRGDVVAYSGTTGWSTACHLHFTVMLDGQTVDPEKFF